MSNESVRRILAITLALLMTWSGSAWALPSSSPPTTPGSTTGVEALTTGFLELAEESRRLRPLLDRSQFDLEALLDKLHRDPERIISFVTEEIALEIYQGVLRGATGTLMSRAGNALDQSLLLATLLKKTGLDAVIRRGELGPEQAETLLSAMARPRKPAPLIWTEEFPGTSPASPESLEAEQRRQELLANALESTDSLLAALKKAGIPLDGGRILEEIRQEARDYYWVDYRESPSKAWKTVHPATGRDLGAAVAKTLRDSVSDALQHRVRLEIIAETTIKNRSKQKPLMKPMEFPSANTLGVPVTIDLIPDQLLNPESPLDPDVIAANTRFLVPVVNGNLPPGAQAVSVNGLVAPAESLGMASGVFETSSAKGKAAIGGLGAVGSYGEPQESSLKLAAIRLRVTFLAPDGSKKVVLRELFDRQRDLDSVAEDDSQGALVRSAARSHSFVFSAGRLPGGFVLDTLLATAVLSDLAVGTSWLSDLAECQTVSCLNEIEAPAIEEADVWISIFQAFDAGLDTGDGQIAYRHVPNLVVVSNPLLAGPTQSRMRTDILSNGRRILAMKDGSLTDAATDLVRMGVWETQTETIFVSSGVFDLEPVSQESLRVYGADDLASSPSGAVAQGMRQEVENGYVVLASQTIPLESSNPAERWWRLDPKSGETLGMSTYGGAPQVAEFLIAEILSTVFTHVIWISRERYHTCYRYYDGIPPVCVVCSNWIVFDLFQAWAALYWLGLTYDEAQAYDFNQKVNSLHRQCASGS